MFHNPSSPAAPATARQLIRIATISTITTSFKTTRLLPGARTLLSSVCVSERDVIDDSTPQGFNGEYAFLGGSFPVLGTDFAPTGQLATIDSIQQYLITEQLLSAGFSSQYITNTLHYGPSKFTITDGNPYTHLNQFDFGPFVQDDWRIRPNLTLSLGLRYEAQTNIGDHNDWAPRVGFAWAPRGGATSGLSRPKLVIRGGWGIFYDRFAVTNVLEAERYSMTSGAQQVYSVNNPAVYDAAFTTTPPASSLSPTAAQYYQIDNNLKSPRLMQTVLGLDKQLTGHTTLSLNLMDSRGIHELLTNNINAPIPTVGALPPGALNGNLGPAIQPYGDIGDIYDYQSVGIFKQFQAMVNVNSQVGRWLTIFSRYVYAQAHSDTDGLTTMPGNPYDIAADWGRSQLDIHHQLFIGGSIAAKWGLRLSPFILLHSGTPYNITTGTDLYDVGQVAATARPQVSSTAFPGSTYSPQVGLYYTTLPLVGEPVIARNYAYGPGFVGVNLRLSKTFGFGTTHFSGQVGGARAGSGGGGGGGGGRSWRRRLWWRWSSLRHGREHRTSLQLDGLDKCSQHSEPRKSEHSERHHHIAVLRPIIGNYGRFRSRSHRQQSAPYRPSVALRVLVNSKSVLHLFQRLALRFRVSRQHHEKLHHHHYRKQDKWRTARYSGNFRE